MNNASVILPTETTSDESESCETTNDPADRGYAATPSEIHRFSQMVEEEEHVVLKTAEEREEYD